MRTCALGLFVAPWLILAAMEVSAPLSAQESVSEASSPLARLLAIPADPAAAVDSHEIHRVLDSLAPDRRRDVFEKLIRAPNDKVACEASTRAMREGHADLSGAVAARMLGADRRFQMLVLDAASSLGSQFVAIPREFVRKVPASPGLPESPDSTMEPIGLAAMLLSSRGVEADKTAILGLAQSAPESSGVWMAIALAGKLNAEAARSASRVYRDEKAPISVRVAAATALQGVDGDARVFAEHRIATFLDYFGQRTMLPMFSAVHEAAPAGSDYEDFSRLTKGFDILTNLLLLNEDDAKVLTMGHIAAPNELIRLMCGTVAVLRWPKGFLAGGQMRFSDVEYADLLALLVAHHPEELGSTESRVTRDQLRDSKMKVDALDVRVELVPSVLAYLVPPARSR